MDRQAKATRPASRAPHRLVALRVDGAKPVELPLKSRDPEAVKRILSGVTRIGGSYVLVLRCKGFPEKTVECRFSSYRVVRERLRVYDVLSGLELTLKIPVIVLDGCSVKPVWDGSRLVWSCDAFTACRCCSYSSGSSIP